MGEIIENDYFKEHLDEYIKDYELKVTKIKKFIGVPFIWVKEGKYQKSYYLFNFLPLMTIMDFSKDDYEH